MTVNNWIAPSGPPVVYRKRHPWLIALLVILALAFYKVTLTLLVVAVLGRLAWHGYRAVKAQNAARRAHEAELRARCDVEDRLWAEGDSRGLYGLGFHQ